MKIGFCYKKRQYQTIEIQRGLDTFYPSQDCTSTLLSISILLKDFVQFHSMIMHQVIQLKGTIA
jgi:hypothetical protein